MKETAEEEVEAKEEAVPNSDQHEEVNHKTDTQNIENNVAQEPATKKPV